MATQDDKLIAALNLDLVKFNKLLEDGVAMTKILKTSLKDLSQARTGKEDLKDWSQVQEKNNKGLKTGADLLRDFYREQRIQDRTTREASQALIGFTVGIASLINIGADGDAVIKRFTTSLLVSVTAMQGAEFSAKGLSIATQGFTGKLGEMSAWLGKNAGMIGVFVGVGAGLISFFQQADEEARKAADGGLADFEKRLAGLTTLGKSQLAKDIKSELDAVNKAIEMNQKTVVTAARGSAPATKTIDIDEKLGKDLRAQRIIYEEALKKTQDQLKVDQAILQANALLNKTIQQNSNIIADIDSQLLELNKKKTQGILLDKDNQRVADKILLLEKQKRELLQTTDESLQKDLKTYGDQYQLGKITTEQYIKQLQFVRERLSDSEKQTDLDKTILQLQRQQKEAELGQTKETKTQIVNIAKDTALQILAIDEQLVLSRATSEEEKIEITRKYALERLKIESKNVLDLLEIEKQALEAEKAIVKTPEQKKTIQNRINAIEVSKTALIGTTALKEKGINQTAEIDTGKAETADDKARKKIREGNVTKGDFAEDVRLMQSKDLNASLIEEEQKLADIKNRINTEQNVKLLESLAVERDISQQKIKAMDDETKAREKLFEQQVVAGFEMYDASKSLEENFKDLTRSIIKRLLAETVASAILSAFKPPTPLSIALAPIFGIAAGALFNQLIPKFGSGGELTRPSLRMAGEAGPEFYMPKKSFYDIAREQIIPTIADIAKRDLVRSNTIINNSRITNGGSVDMRGVEERIERMGEKITKGFISAIRDMPEPVMVLNNPIDFENALRKTFPTVQGYLKKKYPDG